MELTPAEEMLLVSRTPQGRNLGGRIPVVHGVAGGVLLELALHGRVVLSDGRLVAVEGDAGANPGPGHGTVAGGVPGDVLGPEAEALWKRIRAERRPAKPRTWVRRTVSGKAYTRVRAGLAERGILRAEKRRVLGLFPSVGWPEADPGPAAEVRDRLTRAVNGVRADDRTVALVMLLDVCGQSGRLYPDLGWRARKARIAKIAEGPWQSADTAETVRAITKGVQTEIRMAEAADAANDG